MTLVAIPIGASMTRSSGRRIASRRGEMLREHKTKSPSLDRFFPPEAIEDGALFLMARAICFGAASMVVSRARLEFIRASAAVQLADVADVVPERSPVVLLARSGRAIGRRLNARRDRRGETRTTFPSARTNTPFGITRAGGIQTCQWLEPNQRRLPVRSRLRAP